METREKVNFELKPEVFFEAVLLDTKYNETKKMIRNSKGLLQDCLNVWLNCGRYELKSVEKVTRQVAKIA